mmetsp:Transcript_56674/g.93703  ORF Transcript_56674/g.93703 Transcript_56674/m.93703 type:complete len:498 (+) Transcript_56674:93-1586(+)
MRNLLAQRIRSSSFSRSNARRKAAAPVLNVPSSTIADAATQDEALQRAIAASLKDVETPMEQQQQQQQITAQHSKEMALDVAAAASLSKLAASAGHAAVDGSEEVPFERDRAPNLFEKQGTPEQVQATIDTASVFSQCAAGGAQSGLSRSDKVSRSESDDHEAKAIAESLASFESERARALAAREAQRETIRIRRSEAWFLRLAEFSEQSPMVIDMIDTPANAPGGCSSVRLGDVILSIDGHPTSGLHSSLLALHYAPSPDECEYCYLDIYRYPDAFDMVEMLSGIWHSNRALLAVSTMRRLDIRARRIDFSLGSVPGRHGLPLPVISSTRPPAACPAAPSSALAAQSQPRSHRLQHGDVLEQVNGVLVRSLSHAEGIIDTSGVEIQFEVLRWSHSSMHRGGGDETRKCDKSQGVGDCNVGNGITGVFESSPLYFSSDEGPGSTAKKLKGTKPAGFLGLASPTCSEEASAGWDPVRYAAALAQRNRLLVEVLELEAI